MRCGLVFLTIILTGCGLGDPDWPRLADPLPPLIHGDNAAQQWAAPASLPAAPAENRDFAAQAQAARSAYETIEQNDRLGRELHLTRLSVILADWRATAADDPRLATLQEFLTRERASLSR